MKMNENIIKKKKFAYLLGYFMADGCLYNCGRNLRFEFSDGSSVKEELKYSFEFLSYIRNIIQELTATRLPNLRKRGNKFVLCYRNKELANIFLSLGVVPGKKTFTAFIPKCYLNTNLEKYFWIGVMDGDGMVARNFRKISLELGSLFLINGFKKYLHNHAVAYVGRISFKNNNCFSRIDIRSNYFRKYCNCLGFFHPKKRLWMKKHLKNDYYVNNLVDFMKILVGNQYDYSKIFNSDRIFIENGIDLVERASKVKKNVKFLEIFNYLKSKNIPKKEIMLLLSKYRWKMSKGSTKSIKLPLYHDSIILKIASVIRLKSGGIRISRQFCNSEGIDSTFIENSIVRIFDIKPSYSSKGEPLFSSGIIKQFFAKIINKQTDFSYDYPLWHKKLIVRT